MKAKILFPLSLVLILSSCTIGGNSSVIPSSVEPSSSTSSETPSSELSSSSEVISSKEASSEVVSSEIVSSVEPSSQVISSEIISSQLPSSVAPSSEEKPLPVTTGICAFAPSNYSSVWAWTRDAQGHDHNIFDVDWPGASLTKFDDEWNYYNFNDYQSLWIIVSENGVNQSHDFELSSAGYWWLIDGSWTNERPESEPTPEPGPTPTPGELDNRHRTWYQLLVYAFADSNNDGIGDFKGIVQHLDYLKTLGIGGIWLSPVNKAKSYHGYDVKDYYSIESKYEVGGYDMAKLLEECHKRDINVIMDMVVNHTSSEHPWTWEHSSWYSGEHVFDGSMPDLNYDNQAVRTEIKKIGKYWLDKGVDGFRLDGATWIYGGGGNWNVEQDKFNKSVAWWKEYAAYLKTVKEDVYLVGEVWTDLQYIEQFYSAKLNAFNFSASSWVEDSINNSDSSHWVSEWVNFQSTIRQKYSNAVEASFLSNHDTGRFTSVFSDKNKLMLANALNVIAPGGGYVYYGDELGMTGSAGGWGDQSHRTPMPFSSGKTNANNYMGTSASSSTKSGKSADVDMKTSTSMYTSLASVINFKNSVPALYSAAISKVNSPNEAAVMKYETGEEDYYLVLNTTVSKQEITVSGTFESAFNFDSNGKVTVSTNKVSLPSYSFAILKASENLSFSK